MTQAQLNRAVATATGESVRHIAQMGFTLLVLPARARPNPKGNHRPPEGSLPCGVLASQRAQDPCSSR